MNVIISIEELSKSFGKHEVLRKIDIRRQSRVKSSVSWVPQAPDKSTSAYAASTSWNTQTSRKDHAITEKRSGACPEGD